MINTSLTKGLMCLLAKLFPSCSAPELTKFVSKILFPLGFEHNRDVPVGN
jgi:hypothetical protein